uniref:Uncharacterized protein n=1 Tax=Chromera velia CCMP2878 TaxID=1169474 RepID=A0A0G4FKB8_9ALVE|mmetsp:Transcript_42980/g.84746  ORF Transcript_42980/g.84746 Transcript_42980/m.84746 type:complete len:185 (-) Transcript_42980:332-886(-)|eukprot:Cvel_17445.t1-p1 / transcript=Cvel_17445.t1 / gene=Cvel_17445 / organism=Chromera_velia_CCMP2878 / gene_product=hypothetical protein / transcript_product=hypothetical protein / location=Cvel_scaffold1392:13436-14684(-) / protein_length=184 / sequence_SO=supercontig / SO=protein_coding / is_pseudo=false
MAEGKAGHLEPEMKEFLGQSQITYSKKWWRTGSPKASSLRKSIIFDDNLATDQIVDDPLKATAQSQPLHATRYNPTALDVQFAEPPRSGVFSYHKWPQYFSTYQTHFGSIPSQKDLAAKAEQSNMIPGYSGFVPGKYAGNVIGCTVEQGNLKAENHLRSTRQAGYYNVSGSPGTFATTKFTVKE